MYTCSITCLLDQLRTPGFCFTLHLSQSTAAVKNLSKESLGIIVIYHFKNKVFFKDLDCYSGMDSIIYGYLGQDNTVMEYFSINNDDQIVYQLAHYHIYCINPKENTRTFELLINQTYKQKTYLVLFQKISFIFCRYTPCFTLLVFLHIAA